MTATESFRISIPVLAVYLGLSLHACHNAERSNPLDPEATSGVSIGVAENSDGTATINWTPYDGVAPFGKYLILRRSSSVLGVVDTVAVEEDHLVIHVPIPDTVATISDATQTSFVDRALVANQSFVYRVSVINAGGLEISSPESAPVAGARAPRLAFYTNRDGNAEVYVMNADGSGAVNLTNHPFQDGFFQYFGSVYGRPAWSPDGSKIAFVSNRDGEKGEIYVMNSDGSGQTNLTNSPHHDMFPDWSPDGTRIVFASIQDGEPDVHVMNADGSNPVRLTDNPAQDGWPAWSPDGTRIAFTSLRDGNYEIYVMNADGSGQVNITNSEGNDWDARWSPDGQKIIWESSCCPGGMNTMNSDGSDRQGLIDSGTFDAWPDWSPDGSRIAFTSSRDGNNEIYVANADGSGLLRITDNDVDDVFPSWDPSR